MMHLKSLNRFLVVSFFLFGLLLGAVALATDTFPELPTDLSPDEIQVIAEIGHGEEGQVFLVEARGQTFAAKTSTMSPESLMSRFVAPEAGGLPGGAVKISADFGYGTRDAILMNYVEGYNFNQIGLNFYTRETQTPTPAQIERFQQIVLDASKSGMMFSDPNPGNFLFSKDGVNVYVIDQHLFSRAENIAKYGPEGVALMDGYYAGNWKYFEQELNAAGESWASNPDALNALSAEARAGSISVSFADQMVATSWEDIAAARVSVMNDIREGGGALTHGLETLENYGSPGLLETLYNGAKAVGNDPSILLDLAQNPEFWSAAKDIGTGMVLEGVGGYIGEKIATDGLDWAIQADAAGAAEFGKDFANACNSDVACAAASYASNDLALVDYSLQYSMNGEITPDPDATRVTIEGANPTTADQLVVDEQTVAYLYPDQTLSLQNIVTGNVQGTSPQYGEDFTMTPRADDPGSYSFVWDDGTKGVVSPDGYAYDFGFTDESTVVAAAPAAVDPVVADPVAAPEFAAAVTQEPLPSTPIEVFTPELPAEPEVTVISQLDPWSSYQDTDLIASGEASYVSTPIDPNSIQIDTLVSAVDQGQQQANADYENQVWTQQNFDQFADPGQTTAEFSSGGGYYDQMFTEYQDNAGCSNVFGDCGGYNNDFAGWGGGSSGGVGDYDYWSWGVGEGSWGG